MRYVAAAAAVLLLCSCAEDDAGDLRAELAARTTDARGMVPPLPMIRHRPDFRYEAARLRDPFYP